MMIQRSEGSHEWTATCNLFSLQQPWVVHCDVMEKIIVSLVS